MGRELVYICIQPNDLYYVWQVNVWLESAKKNGILNKCQILIYKPDKHAFWNKGWEFLEKTYPEASFFRYEDNGVKNLLRVYIPLLRPHTLAQHFALHRELESKAIFYHDCDIILNRPLSLDDYLDDDICYVSDTVTLNDYMSHSYFNSKRRDVLPSKLPEYDKIDVLAEAAAIIPISKDVIIANKYRTGGAQYLLKNINEEFWLDVQRSSFEIVLYLRSVNRIYFPSEARGFQSWCADMWGVLWNIWKRNIETRTISEMNFCWSSDVKERINDCPILHNAGITSDEKIRTRKSDPNNPSEKIEVEAPAFYKGRWTNSNSTPFQEIELLKDIAGHPISSEYCFADYIHLILEINSKYDIKY